MMHEILAAHHGPKRLAKGSAWRYYPPAPKVLDVPIVGRSEIIAMTGGDPEDRNRKAWFYTQLHEGRFPAYDGPTVDGHPTWQRDTMVVHLYLRTRYYGKQLRRYLIPDLHPEARSLILELGGDPDTAYIHDDYTDDNE